MGFMLSVNNGCESQETCLLETIDSYLSIQLYVFEKSIKSLQLYVFEKSIKSLPGLPLTGKYRINHHKFKGMGN